MLAVTVVFNIKPEAVTEFRRVVLQQAKNSLEKEESCRRFDVCFDDARPAMAFLYELYDDRAAFDLHLASDHFKNFDAESGPLVESRVIETWQLQPAT
ncbi:putative quinol monooxygenase [Pelagibius marinus]|uniref:putative quinol monooxygenase n=1 Tax=Pelagibius marinus TaxID=2762760 RepID=UPI001872AF31|nr:putative quinol monooxygenase [Pelagibius marinus]